MGAGSFRPPPTSPLVMVGLGALLMVAIYTLFVNPFLALSHPLPPVPSLATVTAAKVGLEDASAPLAIEDAGAPREPRPFVWRTSQLSSDAAFELVDGAVGHRPLVAALNASGVSRVDVSRLFKAFERVHNFDHTHPKDTFSIAKKKGTGHLTAFEFATSIGEVWQARENDLGVLEAKKLDLLVERKRVALGVTVGDDLRASMVSAGFEGVSAKHAGQDDDLLKMLDDALDGHAELSDLHPGVRLRVVVSEDLVEGAFARYAEVDAVEYTPENGKIAPIRVYFFGHSAAHAAANGLVGLVHGAYYDAKGHQPTHGGWRTPVPFARISSRFNPHRMHPVLHTVIPHNGVDFAASTGTPVYATAAGVVKIAGDSGPCGNMVQVLHQNGLVSAYCHLSRFAGGLHVGQHVESRQLVGYVGMTGRVTGPHLHFAIKRGEMFLDPLSLKLDGMRVLPPQDRDAFDKLRAEDDLALEAVALPAASYLDAGAPKAGAEDAGLEDTIFDELGGDAGP